ncbi:MAG: TetR/AcrR family transcriptional regulator [Myxococcota bacterium]
MTTPRGEATRRKLLDAALEELTLSGGEIEFAAVTRRAGTSAGLPYRYFKSKSMLIVALVDEFYDAWEAVAYRPTFREVSDDWWACEKVRIEKTVDFFYEHPLGPLISRLCGDAEVMGRMRQRVDAQVRGATKNLRRGQKLGRVPAHLDAPLCGALLMGGISLALAQAQAKTPPVRRGRLVCELQQFMRRVLCIEEYDHAS